MKTKFIEGTNRDQNWGKFMVAVFDDNEWLRPSEISPGRSLLMQRGWAPGHIWVMDLETGEGLFIRPGGLAAADLQKHAVWVCPLFLPFLTWLYQNWTGNLDDLPNVVQLPDAEFAMWGYRRSGQGKDLPVSMSVREMIAETELHLSFIAKGAGIRTKTLEDFMDGKRDLTLKTADKIAKYLSELRIHAQRKASQGAARVPA